MSKRKHRVKLKCSKCGTKLKPDEMGETWFANQYSFPRLCLRCYLAYVENDHGAAFVN